MKRHLRISVRSLVEHSLRSGDLNLERLSRSGALDGLRGHQKLQSARPEGYCKEVPVSLEAESEHFLIEVHGRIDGVFEPEDRLEESRYVEEIKTTRDDLGERIDGATAAHWGQLLVYGYLYCEEKGLERIRLRLTYFHLETEESLASDRVVSRDELRELFENLVARYTAWMKRVSDWREHRNRSIARVGFPYSCYRPGQRNMAVEVYRTVRDGERLLVRAPTGIGKTLGTLFPSIKAMAEGATDKIFYVTARTTGRALAEEALAKLRARGLELKSLTLTAREKICFNPEKACNGDECDFARGFYDRLEAALQELFEADDFTRATLERLARKHVVCPFELSLELALWADVVIGDYNYVFDPRAYLRRFFDDPGGEWTLLVDEAHNLVDRSRDMYSSALHKTRFLSVRRSLRGERYKRLRRRIGEVNRFFLETGKRCEGSGGKLVERTLPEALLPRLTAFVRECESLLSEGVLTGEQRAQLKECYFEAGRFLQVAERFDETYVTCYETAGRETRVLLFCTDASSALGATLEKTKASVFFSATLSPLPYFRSTLGCGEKARSLSLSGPFPRSNLEVLMADRIPTTYRRRAASESDLVEMLLRFVTHRRGNYMLYFPSYEYLSAVRTRFESRAIGIATGVEILSQARDMTEPERESFLSRFRRTREGTLVGFAVMGGFFGEGIDLVGEHLTGVAIVSVGIPALSPERDSTRDYYERKLGAGFDYAYAFPGMNRVLQAAGRVIRTELDRGVVLLVDERFSQPRYRSLMPSEWRPVAVARPEELEARLERFWMEEDGG